MQNYTTTPFSTIKKYKYIQNNFKISLNMYTAAFLLGCIGVRAGLTAWAAVASPEVLRGLGFFALVPVAGWLWIMLVSGRDRGLEAPGGRIWWQALRPLHAALWGTFAALAISGNRHAWTVLAADTTLGLAAWSFYPRK